MNRGRNFTIKLVVPNSLSGVWCIVWLYTGQSQDRVHKSSNDCKFFVPCSLHSWPPAGSVVALAVQLNSVVPHFREKNVFAFVGFYYEHFNVNFSGEFQGSSSKKLFRILAENLLENLKLRYNIFRKYGN